MSPAAVWKTEKAQDTATRLDAAAVGQEADAGQVPAPTEVAQVATRPTGANNPQTAEILGRITWLLLQSPAHKHLFLNELEWLVVPPIMLRQFRLWRKDNLPVAFASWALLTEDAEKRLSAGSRKLAPAEWRAGDRLWLVDIVAPFGGLDSFIGDLRKNVFPGRSFKALQSAPDGLGLRIVEWQGERLNKPV